MERMYNVLTVGLEVLNLDGPLTHDEALALADYLDEHYNIDVHVAAVEE